MKVLKGLKSVEVYQNYMFDLHSWLKDQDEKLPDAADNDTIASLKDKASKIVVSFEH